MLRDTVMSTLRRFMDDCGVPTNYQNDVLRYLTRPHGLLAGENLSRPVDTVTDVRLNEIIRTCGMQAILTGDYVDHSSGWVANIRYILDKSTWSVGKQGQFSSCSYPELTSCVHHRVLQLREYREFLNTETEFNSIRWLVRMSSLSLREEIKYLLKRRREIQRDRRVATAVLNKSLKDSGFVT
jgi:hypothetical protein